MKQEIHPVYNPMSVTCSCGEVFETRSTYGKPLSIEVCAQCHPFYTGKQKVADNSSRGQRFRERYSRNRAKAE